MSKVEDETRIKIGVQHCRDVDDPLLIDKVIINFTARDTVLHYSTSQDGSITYEDARSLPPFEERVIVTLTEILYSDFSYDAVYDILGFLKKDSFVALLVCSVVAREAMKAATADIGDGTDYVKAVAIQVEVDRFMKAWTPRQMCLLCLEEFRSCDKVEKKGKCGHAYHDACLPYYREHGIECPFCDGGSAETDLYGPHRVTCDLKIQAARDVLEGDGGFVVTASELEKSGFAYEGVNEEAGGDGEGMVTARLAASWTLHNAPVHAVSLA